MNPYDYANALVSIHPDINTAWELKDELTDFYVSNTLETAPAALKKSHYRFQRKQCRRNGQV